MAVSTAITIRLGAWYYGGDISVHPDFRRRGVGSRLYEARKGIVKDMNRRGIVAGGLIPGFAAYKGRLSPREYVNKVVDGEINDSTLSFQLGRGFEVRGLLENYIEDEASDNWATLIVWENPSFNMQMKGASGRIKRARYSIRRRRRRRSSPECAQAEWDTIFRRSNRIQDGP